MEDLELKLECARLAAGNCDLAGQIYAFVTASGESKAEPPKPERPTRVLWDGANDAVEVIFALVEPVDSVETGVAGVQALLDAAGRVAAIRIRYASENLSPAAPRA